MSFFIAGQICSRHVEFSYCQTKAEQTRGIQLLAERILQTYWLQWSWEIYLADILIQQRSEMYLANILTRTLARFALPKQLSAGTFLQPPLMSMREGPSACSLLHSKDFLPCANKSTAPHGSYASKHKNAQENCRISGWYQIVIHKAAFEHSRHLVVRHGRGHELAFGWKGCRGWVLLLLLLLVRCEVYEQLCLDILYIWLWDLGQGLQEHLVGKGCRGRVRLLFLGCEDMNICLCTAKQDDASQNQKLPELFSLVADAEHGRNHSWCKATTGEHTWEQRL